MIATADLSPCGRYRYTLGRAWDISDTPRRIVFVMLNPSTADGHKDDPTIRRVCHFARDWNFNTVTVVNLFAYRATYPEDLIRAEAGGVDISGPGNKAAIENAISTADDVVFAWGARRVPMLPFWSGFAYGVARKHGKVPKCVGVSKEGAPRHPLFMPADAERFPWEPRP